MLESFKILTSKPIKVLDLKEKFPEYVDISKRYLIPENENSIFINLIRQTLYPDTFLSEKIFIKRPTFPIHFDPSIFNVENLSKLLKHGVFKGDEDEIEEIEDLQVLFKSLLQEPWFWEKIQEAFWIGHALILMPLNTKVDYTGILKIPPSPNNEFILKFFVSYPFYRWKEDGFWIDNKKLLVYPDKVLEEHHQYIKQSTNH